jgi:hypothetical protein
VGGKEKYRKIGLCLTKGNKNWTSVTVFLMNSNFLQRDYGRISCFF